MGLRLEIQSCPPCSGGGKENLLTLPTTTLHGGHFHENTKFVKSTRVHTYTYIYINILYLIHDMILFMNPSYVRKRVRWVKYLFEGWPDSKR